MFTGIGALSRWSWPDIEGLNTFGGRLIHSAQWDVEGSTWQEDWKDKNVGVIGVVSDDRRRGFIFIRSHANDENLFSNTGVFCDPDRAFASAESIETF